MKIRLIIFKLKREQNVFNNKLICVVKRLLNSMWRARSNVVKTKNVQCFVGLCEYTRSSTKRKFLNGKIIKINGNSFQGYMVSNIKQSNRSIDIFIY